VLVQALPKFQLRWIAKKELLHVPFFGWAMWASKHVTIDRSDPQDAVKA
jgi:1-acyl-sn-glycerol-3-phosphate acyltransferase